LSAGVDQYKFYIYNKHNKVLAVLEDFVQTIIERIFDILYLQAVVFDLDSLSLQKLMFMSENSQ